MVKMAGIEIRNLHKTYPVDDRTLHVLKGIDVNIPEKSITVILGRSG
jgi:ABC-type lipoprotein export system ATPase subunit